jgi:leucyl-tRNA synthetase
VAGGIDDNEDPLKAIVRETYEETGYKVKAVEKVGGIIESHFFAENKNVWRYRHDQHILCELESEEQDDVDGEERDRHEAIWMSGREALEKITHHYNKMGISRFLKENYSFCDYGYLINSGEFDGMSSDEAKKKITEKLKSNGAGDFTINYKLRDWIFSRQHYWGEPIPIIYCHKCFESLKLKNKNLKLRNISIIDDEEYMLVPLSENDLPLTLPSVKNYQPTNTGESPLASIDLWVNVKCPKCGGSAKRETDTMPNWAGSSWYFLAYTLKNSSWQLAAGDKNKNIFDLGANELNHWMSVDLYNGGMEHTTLHLLYSRFWNKFLFDLGVVPTTEPYQKRIAHGIILGPDGRKMSKSFGNVINPDDIVKQYGADTTRAYIMFIGPYDAESAWSTAGVAGVSRFLTRVWNNFAKMKDGAKDSKELLIKINQTINGITHDLENFQMNTVVSKLMELNNAIEKAGTISQESYDKFIQLLFPVAPHLASELWDKCGHQSAIYDQKWPEADKNYLIADEIEVVVQINGKIRDKISVSSGIDDEDLKKAALESSKINDLLAGRKIVKTIVVPKKLVSLVVK